MLELGIFGGWYFKGDISEYPKEWFVSAKISHTGFDSTLNYFKVASGQAMSVWKEKGWITSEDPLGWFQWYCRYSLGRRISEVGEFQMKRWKVFGPRHIGGIKNHCEPHDIWCRPKQRQALLQWTYDPFI